MAARSTRHPKGKTRRNRRTLEGAQVGAVTVYHPDGTVETREPYSDQKVAAVIRKGRTVPRTWDDRGPGRYGGGNDFLT